MMKLSEFVLTHTKGGGLLSKEYFAEVSVTTGFLWWKRTERRKIYREGGYWSFMDSGEFTPKFQAEALERAYRARESLRELEQEKQ
jgi:hypothetical protein